MANKSPSHHLNTSDTSDAAQVFEAEKKHLKISDQDSISGLAISGGGIRSASFGLGVMQALVANKQLSKMDYMSTVSGGGYLGAALTWALKQGGDKVGTTPDKFPLGKRVTKGIKEEDPLRDLDFDAKDNKLLDYIRQHATYLTPTNSLDMTSFVAVVIRSVLLSLFVYFSVLMVFMTLVTAMFYVVIQGCGLHCYFPSLKLTLNIIGIALFFIMVVYGFLYSLGTYFSSDSGIGSKYEGFIKGQILIGVMMKASLACFFIASIPYVYDWIIVFLKPYLFAGGSTLFGTLVGFWQYIKAQRNEATRGIPADLLVYAGAFALFYGVFMLAYIVGITFFLNGAHQIIQPAIFFIIAGLAIVFGLIVNLNLIGPHRIWRNRLMEAFMPNKEAVNSNSWNPATDADGALMENMCDENNPKPYHIINTNIILANSPKVKFKGRGGDNFIISPMFCGSDATAWITTHAYQKKKGRGVTLATAMATSAAALNPNAGVSGEGVTRNLVVSVLLSFLNLRLGYWASNPSKDKLMNAPNFFAPGISSEILRYGFTENHANIQLSDGGHFENLAFYELIRRKLNFIVVSDGGADPLFNFDDLANAIEKVRVDFDAKIRFREGYKLGDILPGTAGKAGFLDKYEIAKHGYAIADINYNDNSTGVLVYLKLAMIEGLPTDVYSYKGVNPSFPHQSTSDQFFDEKQFEAYRELGYNVAWQMMESEEGKKLFV